MKQGKSKKTCPVFFMPKTIFEFVVLTKTPKGSLPAIYIFNVTNVHLDKKCMRTPVKKGGDNELSHSNYDPPFVATM